MKQRTKVKKGKEYPEVGRVLMQSAYFLLNGQDLKVPAVVTEFRKEFSFSVPSSE